MPYRRKRPIKKRKVKKKNYKSLYRQAIPKTLQIATRRNYNQRLKFVVNQTYLVDNSQLPVGRCTYLHYLANSIYNVQIGTEAINGVWRSQAPIMYGNNTSAPASPASNASGWDEWQSRYQHFCVTGSKIHVTYEPYNSGDPTMLFITKSGTVNTIDSAKTSEELNLLPYTTRKSMVTSNNQNANGCSAFATYSARKFEGVKDPNDNSNLRGTFGAGGNTASRPSETSHYYITLAPTDPNAQGKMASGVMRVKIEYIVTCTEPTTTNNVQQRAEAISDITPQRTLFNL